MAAAGMFAIYVVLTCVFYFVGLAYDNVSEVTLFILFMGALDSAVSAHGLGLAPADGLARRRRLSAGTEVPPVRKPRLLILIVAYNAEKTISPVLARVPHQLAEEYDVEVLVLDDSSQDRTFEQSRDAQREGTLPFPLHVLFNPVNQGYGGNQKIGYHFAHEARLRLRRAGPWRRPVRAGMSARIWCGRCATAEADAVFGSRMLDKGGARRGGMPLYKFVGNRILSWFQNRVLGASLSEFHSGYRVYSVAALATVPFELNTNDFHFDTEIIIQFLLVRPAHRRAADPDLLWRRDLPRQRHQIRLGRHQGGARRPHAAAGSALRPALRLRAGREQRAVRAEARLRQPALRGARDRPGRARGCSTSAARAATSARCCAAANSCRVTGVDKFPLGPGVELDAFVLHDLNDGLPAGERRRLRLHPAARRHRASGVA